MDMQHVLAYHDPDHACNQGSLIKLANGELLLGYNQERGRVHADSGQSCLIKSTDGGQNVGRRDASHRVAVERARR